MTMILNPHCRLCSVSLISRQLACALSSEGNPRKHEVVSPKAQRLEFPPLPSVQDLLRIYRLKSLRFLAQNFLVKEDVAREIAWSLGSLRGKHVYEIGPGPGIITREILKQHPASLTTIEKDFRFIPILKMLKSAAKAINCDVNLIKEDCLQHDFGASSSALNINPQPWEGSPPDIVIMGNLPFNVSLPFLIRLFYDIDNRRGLFQHGRVRMAFTFQREVAEKFGAEPSTPNRGRLSIMGQNFCHANHLYTISNKVFVPKPECETGLVTFEPRVEKLISDVPIQYVEKVVKATMHYKNKGYIKGIRDLFPKEIAKEWSSKFCEEAGVEPLLVPTQLTFEDYAKLARLYMQLCEQFPGLFEYEYRDKKSPVSEDLMKVKPGSKLDQTEDFPPENDLSDNCSISSLNTDHEIEKP